MSQSSRQRLAADAEKLYACHQLWVCHNAFLEYVPISCHVLDPRLIDMWHSSGATHSVLNEAIFAYMNEVAEGHHDDIVRAFFRYRVGDIGNLFSHVMEITRKSAYELGRSLSVALPEANRIVLVSLCPFV